jgi:hypothetical protein
MQKKPYIILAPPYRHNSAGVRALYELRNQLEYRGYSVSIMSRGYSAPNTIVIYPETVSGNPLNGKTVVRWILNYPGLLGGDKKYDENEIIFTWSENFFDAPILTVPIIEDFFRNERLQRNGGCFWVGKGAGIPRIPETEGCVEITSDWPATRRDLALLLNSKEVFFTYDNNTALITEAKRCGCQVIIIGEEKESDDDFTIDYENQIENFIRITQAAEPKENKLKVAFGVLVNDLFRLDMVFRKSELDASTRCHSIKLPSTACKALNKLLDIIEADDNDIAILSHQDMFYPYGWLDIVKDKISELPDSWVAAGIIGKDMEGEICGLLHDMRLPLHFNSGHTYPEPASCFDECCIIVNLKKGFRFDENLKGFDLYGTMAVLQAWEMNGTAWIIDAFAEHYCLRPFPWIPGKQFMESFKWLHRRFPNAPRISSTVLIEKKARYDDVLNYKTLKAGGK